MSAVPAESTSAAVPSTSSTPPVISRWPRSLAALEVPNYRMFLGSQLVANTGLWMQRIAQDWLVLELSGSVTAVGVAVALQFTPVLIFGLFGGVIADRYSKRGILMITQSVATLAALTLGFLALSGAVQVWHVYLIAVVLGFVTVVDNPTRQVFVSELVGTQHIRNAISLNSSVFQIGGLLGPAISGALISAVGQGWSFLINALACSGVVTILAIIRPAADAITPTVARAKGQLREGLRYIKNTSEIAWTIILVATMGLFGMNMTVILAAFADSEFSNGVGGYSLFNSLIAIGALTGALISARRKGTLRLRVLVACLTVLGTVMIIAAFAPSIWLFGILLVGIGLMTLTFLTAANSLVQITAAPTVRGRVMGVYLLVMLGGQALGGPAVGWLIDHIGARPSMVACGAMVGLIAAVSGVAMARRSRLTLSWDRQHGRAPLHIVRH